MRVTAISFSSSQIAKQQINTNKKISSPITKPQPKEFIFNDWFKKVDMTPIQELKTNEGNPRFNKNELKEIKSCIKSDKLTTNTVKYLADTMLDVKSMSQAYLFAKDTKDSAKELAYIKNNVKNVEKPFKNWSDNMKEGLFTKLEYEKDNKQYKITDASETKIYRFKEGNQKISSQEITSTNNRQEDDTSNSTPQPYPTNENGGLTELLDPLNPNSPMFF